MKYLEGGKNTINGFFDFIRERGVAGFAIGFILGGSVSKLVGSLVSDIINPCVSYLFGSVKGIQSLSVSLGASSVMYGNFLSNMIDFLIIALVVYIGFKMLGLEKMDKKK